MRACEAVRARRGEAGARSSRAVQAACEPHARSGTATAAGSRWPRRNARTMGSSRRRASLTRHAGHFSTAGVRRDGATARPRHRSAENDVGDDGDGGHDSCAAIARRSDDDGTRQGSKVLRLFFPRPHAVASVSQLICEKLRLGCGGCASCGRPSTASPQRDDCAPPAAAQRGAVACVSKLWQNRIGVPCFWWGGSRSNRPIKKRGEMDRWEEESVQTTHKEKR